MATTVNVKLTVEQLDLVRELLKQLKDNCDKQTSDAKVPGEARRVFEQKSFQCEMLLRVFS